jgi:hypothetical protein
MFDVYSRYFILFNVSQVICNVVVSKLFRVVPDYLKFIFTASVGKKILLLSKEM